MFVSTVYLHSIAPSLDLYATFSFLLGRTALHVLCRRVAVPPALFPPLRCTPPSVATIFLSRPHGAARAPPTRGPPSTLFPPSVARKRRADLPFSTARRCTCSAYAWPSLPRFLSLPLHASKRDDLSSSAARRCTCSADAWPSLPRSSLPSVHASVATVLFPSPLTALHVPCLRVAVPPTLLSPFRCTLPSVAIPRPHGVARALPTCGRPSHALLSLPLHASNRRNDLLSRPHGAARALPTRGSPSHALLSLPLHASKRRNGFPLATRRCTRPTRGHPSHALLSLPLHASPPTRGRPPHAPISLPLHASRRRNDPSSHALPSIARFQASQRPSFLGRTALHVPCRRVAVPPTLFPPSRPHGVARAPTRGCPSHALLSLPLHASKRRNDLPFLGRTALHVLCRRVAVPPTLFPLFRCTLPSVATIYLPRPHGVARALPSLPRSPSPSRGTLPSVATIFPSRPHGASAARALPTRGPHALLSLPLHASMRRNDLSFSTALRCTCPADA